MLEGLRRRRSGRIPFQRHSPKWPEGESSEQWDAAPVSRPGAQRRARPDLLEWLDSALSELGIATEGAVSAGTGGVQSRVARPDPPTRTAPTSRVVVRGGLAGWYEETFEFFFNARHALDGCQTGSVHPHTWRVRVIVGAQTLDEDGTVPCSGAIRDAVSVTLARWEDRYLNRIAPFDAVAPTTANLAAVLYQQLVPALDGEPDRMLSVGVWETPTHGVTYRARG